MEHYSRHIQGWFLNTDIYGSRTKAEGEMADFVEIAFRPDMALEDLKFLVDDHIKTLPESLQKSFQVVIRRAGRIGFVDLGWTPYYALCVRYKARRIIQIIEPTNQQFHDAKRQLADVH